MKKQTFKVLRIIAIIVLIGIIIFEAVKIYLDQREYAIADEEYTSIQKEYVTIPTVPKIADTVETTIEYPQIAIDFDSLEEVNSDFTGWLYIPCLDISYPVVKENYIDEYLHKTFEGGTNKAGCLFEDVLSDAQFRGMHDIIFGHNMKNLSMFGSLKLLYQKGNEKLLEENPYLYVYTRDYVFQYRVFGYYTTKVGSEAYKVVKTNDSYDELVDYIARNSAYERPKDADFSERPSILTLSTCSGASGSSRRLVVHSYKTAAWARQ